MVSAWLEPKPLHCKSTSSARLVLLQSCSQGLLERDQEILDTSPGSSITTTNKTKKSKITCLCLNGGVRPNDEDSRVLNEVKTATTSLSNYKNKSHKQKTFLLGETTLGNNCYKIKYLTFVINATLTAIRSYALHT